MTKEGGVKEGTEKGVDEYDSGALYSTQWSRFPIMRIMIGTIRRVRVRRINPRCCRDEGKFGSVDTIGRVVHLDAIPATSWIRVGFTNTNVFLSSEPVSERTVS